MLMPGYPVIKRRLSVYLLLTVVLFPGILFLTDAAAQSADSKCNPLQRYLQENYDSTILYATETVLNQEPHYYILSRLNNQVALATYINPYSSFNGHANKTAEIFIREQIIFRNTLADTNRYFLPVYLPVSNRLQIWDSLIANFPWQLQDDSISGEGCNAPRKPGCEIYDGTTAIFFLITKNQIKKLVFYEPAEYEKCCPGRNDRVAVIRMIAIFNKAFRVL